MKLSENEIHLWLAYDENIADQGLLARYHRLLNRQESLQQKRFYFEKHRHQYLVTRAMVRSVLSLYVDEIAPASWKFENNDYGKPAIANSSSPVPLRFNISHADKLIVMAVTVGREVGVDVEYLLRPGKNVEIAESFFSPLEVSELRELSEEKQKERFFALWTLKEAYIKACGMGLSIPLDHFSYTFPVPGEVAISFVPQRDDHPEYWRFWQIQPHQAHRVSMALKGDEISSGYSISMKEIVPLSNILEVSHPVIHTSKTPA